MTDARRHPDWNPQPADRILLAGADEAIDTIALILATLPATARGQVFVEVESDADVGVLDAPGRVTVCWLVRDRGQSLAAIRGCLAQRDAADSGLRASQRLRLDRGRRSGAAHHLGLTQTR